MQTLELIANLCGKSEKSFAMITPVFDLALRLWVAKVFFMSGLTKVKSWETTLFLFEYEYEVPLLSPVMAASLGTIAELLLPVFLLLGFLSRPVAFGLFIFNTIAVYSYGSFLFGDQGAAGLQQHILWGVMLLATLFHGPGKLSLDTLVMKRFGGAGN
jgi:putative oxidoreductase